MSSTRLVLIAVTAAALTIASRVPGAAQIVYPFPPYRGGFLDGSVHFDVRPQDAQVYVDGYFAGVVDEFDGPFQRLRVEPGQHEITLYHERYRTYRQRVYLARDRTFRVRTDMEPLSPGEPAEPRPTPTPVQASIQPARPLPGGTPSSAVQPAVGQLVIRIDPADATLMVDGQPWPLAPGETTVTIDVAGGRHVVQVRRAGYVGYLTEVDVRPGETTNVTVTLRPVS